MKAVAYEIDIERQLKPIQADRVVELLADGDKRIWLDILAASPAETAEWLDRLSIRGLARRICLESQARAGFYPLRDDMILVAPVLLRNRPATETDQITFIRRERLMVTFHQKSVFDKHEHVDLDDAAEWLAESSVSNLFAALLLDVSSDCLMRVSTLRGSVVALEDRLDRDPDSVQAEDILELRAELLAHEMVVSEQLPPMQAIASSDQLGGNAHAAIEYINCALANLLAADRILERLDSRVGELRLGFQMHSQDKTNRRLGMLTILSAIFMPITLMAGIWGMNFEVMPELGLKFGYLYALGGMALVATSMFLFFRRQGWFG